MSEGVRLAFALRAGTARMVSIDAVMRGLMCECVCPQCHSRLVAVQGDVVRHHFRHYIEGAACPGARETALHLMAKQVICERLELTLPRTSFPVNLGKMLSARAEMVLDGLRPDVFACYGSENVAIEIHVTHAVPPEKIALLHERDLPAIEIDLSHYRDMEQDEDMIAGAVLHRAPRRWLHELRCVREARDIHLANLRDAARLAKEEAERRERQLWTDQATHREAWLIAEASRRAQLALAEAELAEARRSTYEKQEREAELARTLQREAERERRGPSLTELVEAHGRWDQITPEAWVRFHYETEVWKMKLRGGYFYQNQARYSFKKWGI